MQSRADYYEIIIEGHIDHHRFYLADNISAEYLAGGQLACSVRSIKRLCRGYWDEFAIWVYPFYR